jgi:hypothetical protein
MTWFAGAAGATSGSVTDVDLPTWSARKLPVIQPAVAGADRGCTGGHCATAARRAGCGACEAKDEGRPPGAARCRGGRRRAAARTTGPGRNAGDAARVLQTMTCPSGVGCRDSAPCTALRLLTRVFGSVRRATRPGRTVVARPWPRRPTTLPRPGTGPAGCSHRHGQARPWKSKERPDPRVLERVHPDRRFRPAVPSHSSRSTS